MSRATRGRTTSMEKHAAQETPGGWNRFASFLSHRAMNLRVLQVEQNKINLGGRDPVQCLLAILGGQHHVTIAAQSGGKLLAHPAIVIGQEDARIHGRDSFAGGRETA
jgi:hypothetical protein